MPQALALLDDQLGNEVGLGATAPADRFEAGHFSLGEPNIELSSARVRAITVPSFGELYSSALYNVVAGPSVLGAVLGNRLHIRRAEEEGSAVARNGWQVALSAPGLDQMARDPKPGGRFI